MTFSYLEDRLQRRAIFAVFKRNETMRLYIFTLLLFFNYAFAKAQEEQTPAPVTPVITTKIPLGKTVIFENVAVEFTSVSDSRCPKGTQCIWAGQAEVIVLVKEKGEDAVVKEIILSPTKALDKTIYTYGDLSIEVIDVKPYPDATVPTIKENYYILVKSTL